METAESVPETMRVKNRLSKQDEIEVSDEEEATLSAAAPALTSGQIAAVASSNARGQDGKAGSQARRRSKKNTSPAPRIVTEKLPKQVSAPATSGVRQATLEQLKPSGDAGPRKASVPLAQVQIMQQGEMQARPQQLSTPRHLGSMAFSSLSTEETSSICDTDALGRQMGLLSLQGSLQDDNMNVLERGNSEESVSVGDFLMQTWHERPQDRQFLLQYERAMEELIKTANESTSGEETLQAPVLNSYYRMLLHRLAGFWNVEHSIQPNTEKRVVLRATGESHRPAKLFREMLEPGIEVPEMSQNRIRTFHKRGQHSLPETSGSSLLTRPPITTARSLDERRFGHDQEDVTHNAGFYGQQMDRHLQYPYYGPSHNYIRSDVSEAGSGEYEGPSPRLISYPVQAGMIAPGHNFYAPAAHGFSYPPHAAAAAMGGQCGEASMEVPGGCYVPGAQPVPYYGPLSLAVYPQAQYGTSQQPLTFLPASTMFPQHSPSIPQPHQQVATSQQMCGAETQQGNSFDSSGQYLVPCYPYTDPQQHFGMYPTQQVYHSDARFGAPLIQQPAPIEYSDPNINLSNPEGLIIPLRFPLMANSPGQPALNMFLKIPLARPPHTPDEGQSLQRTSSSGRSSSPADQSSFE